MHFILEETGESGMAESAPVLVLASRNRKKMRELSALLQPYAISLKTADDFPEAPEIDETGDTFAENAKLKATGVAGAIRQWALADDSGLAVDSLRGAPGVYSARYAGVGATDQQNNDQLLKDLQDVADDQRWARFVCHLSLSDPQGHERLSVGESCRGQILREPLGAEGFGYDPLFWIPEYHQTFGQLGLTVKEFLSHRSRALRLLIPQMVRLWETEGLLVSGGKTK